MYARGEGLLPSEIAEIKIDGMREGERLRDIKREVEVDTSCMKARRMSSRIYRWLPPAAATVHLARAGQAVIDGSKARVVRKLFPLAAFFRLESPHDFYFSKLSSMVLLLRASSAAMYSPSCGMSISVTGVAFTPRSANRPDVSRAYPFLDEDSLLQGGR